MEEASFMEHVKMAPSNDEIFNNPMFDDEDEDDDSFVPESLRMFMQDANAKLDADLSDILGNNNNNKTDNICNPVANIKGWMEDDDDDDDMDMDEDDPPPPPVMPDDIQEVQIVLNNNPTNTSITTRSSMRRREAARNNNNDNDDCNQYEPQEEEETMMTRLEHMVEETQKDKDKYSIPEEEEEEYEEPIMARLEQMDFEPMPSSTMDYDHQAKTQTKSYTELTTREMLQPKPIPDPNALDHETTTSSQFFQDILKQEEDLSLKHNLMMGLLDEDKEREERFKEKQRRQQALEQAQERERLRELQRKQEQHYYEEDSSIPPLESMNAPIIHQQQQQEEKNAKKPTRLQPMVNKEKSTLSSNNHNSILESKLFEDDDDDDDAMLEELLGDRGDGGMNPAAFLTAGEAKDMALDGVLPPPALEPDSDDDDENGHHQLLARRDLSAELLRAEQDFGTLVVPAATTSLSSLSSAKQINVKSGGTPKNPSPPKRPKLEGMDAILGGTDKNGGDESDDYDKIEPEMANLGRNDDDDDDHNHEDDEKERSYISSSSDEEKGGPNIAKQPLSPPSIVHQTDTPPSLQEVKQTLSFNPTKNITPTLDTTTTASSSIKTKKIANRLQPPKPEVEMKKQPTMVNDASSKLLDYLHPDINENKSDAISNKASEIIIQPLFPDVTAAKKETEEKPLLPAETTSKAAEVKPLLPTASTATEPLEDKREAIVPKLSSATEENRPTPVKMRASPSSNGTPPKPPKTPDHPTIQTPPSKSQMKQTNAAPPSPMGAVDNLFDYLHPTVEISIVPRKKQPVQRKQLFAGPPTVEAKPKTQPAKDRPATEVTILPRAVASPSMSRTNQPTAFSPTSSIGFGSPTSELRLKRQMVQEQQSVQGSPMSMTSAGRRKGHSPLVHKKFPPREVTSPDKNIPSRLLQGTAATRAKQHGEAVQPKPKTRRNAPMGESIKSMAATRIATKTTVSSPPASSAGSHFMQPTAASRRLTSRTKTKTTVERTSPKRTITKITTTSRLMQPTQASQALVSKSTVPPPVTETASSNLADQKATRARVRERMAASKRGATQSNREKKAEQKRNIKSTMDRVRERKERLARMEQERVAKLKAKIAERDKKAQERKAKIEAERTSPVKVARTRTRAARSAIPRPLTVPKGPNFLTDKRLKRQQAPKEEIVPLANADGVLMRSFRDDQSMGSATGERKLTIPKTPYLATKHRADPQEERKEEMIPLANADAVLMRSFRDDQSMGGGSTTGERRLTIPKTPMLATKQRGEPREKPKEEMVPLAAADTVLMRSFRDDQSMGGGSAARRLTIPKTPNLSTTKKYGDKSAAKQPGDDEGSVHHWQDGLRAATSPSNKSVCSQLTIPQTPNFQPSRKREPILSTAEREQAEMEYYRAHPFKARPVGSGIKHVPSTAKKKVEKRKPTVPKPFHLSSGRRTTPDHRDESRRESSGQPKTLFPAPRGTPVEGFTMRAKRSTTTPKPFKLSSTRRQSSSPPESADVSVPPRKIAEKPTGKFQARPMPKFDSVSIPVREKDPSKLRSPPSKKPEEVKPFKARGVPKFLSQPSIPVRRRDPSKLRSPDYVKTSPEYQMRYGKTQRKLASPEPSTSKPYRAKPAPIRSPPDIPVRSRDPGKLRPVTSKKQSVPAPPSLKGSSYSSSAASLEPRVDKRKAIRENMRQRMKERRGKAASGSVATTDSSQVGASLDTTVTSSSDGVSSSYGESGLSTSYEESGFSTSYAESTLRTKSVQATSNFGQSVATEDGVSLNTARERSLLQAAMKKRPNGEASLTAVPTAESEASTPVTKGGQSNKEELRNAMGGWMIDSVPATANAGLVAARGKPATTTRGDRISEIRRMEPDPLEVARIAEEKRKREELMRKQRMSKSYEETTQMAAHLQKQLEDALSFEATYRAGDDLDHGYIGEPTGGLGRFDL